MTTKALLLIGSPKPASSTSESIGDYLLKKLDDHGVSGEKMKLTQVLRNDEGRSKLISSVNNCDILIIVSPLYVDSAPAIVTKAMEMIHRARIGQELLKRPKMMAICNSGFPEAHQNYPALEIYSHFADESGFHWIGGVALGGGGAIDGRPLESRGGMVRNVVKSLDIIAFAIAKNKQIPDEAVQLMEKPIVPNWLYIFFGQIGWVLQARKYGAERKLNDRPYEK